SVPNRSLLFEHVDSGQYNLVAGYEFGVDPSFLNRYYTSGGDMAWTGYASGELDNLLLEALSQNDPNGRRSLYNQAQRIIMEQALVLPIRDYVNLNGSRTSVQNLTYDAY